MNSIGETLYNIIMDVKKRAPVLGEHKIVFRTTYTDMHAINQRLDKYDKTISDSGLYIRVVFKRNENNKEKIEYGGMSMFKVDKKKCKNSNDAAAYYVNSVDKSHWVGECIAFERLPLDLIVRICIEGDK
jgi:hypothetical protein